MNVAFQRRTMTRAERGVSSSSKFYCTVPYAFRAAGDLNMVISLVRGSVLGQG